MSVRFFSIFLSVFLVACGGSGVNEPQNNDTKKNLVFAGQVELDGRNFEGKEVTLYRIENGLTEKNKSTVDRNNQFKVAYTSEIQANSSHIVKTQVEDNLVFYSVAKGNRFTVNLIEHFKAAFALYNSSQGGASILNSDRYTKEEYETVYLPKIVDALKALSQERGIQFNELVNGIFERIKTTGSTNINGLSLALSKEAAVEYKLLLKNNPNTLFDSIYRTKNHVFNVSKGTVFDKKSTFSVSNELVKWEINGDFLTQDLAIKGLQLNPKKGQVRNFFLSLYQGNQSGIKITALGNNNTPAFNRDWSIYLYAQNPILYSKLRIYLAKVEDGYDKTAACGSGNLIEERYLEDKITSKLTVDKKWLNLQNSHVQLSATVTDVLGNTHCLKHENIYSIRNDHYEIIDSYPKPNGFVLSSTKKPFLLLKTGRPLKGGYKTYQVLQKQKLGNGRIVRGEGYLKLNNTKQADGSYLVKVTCGYLDCADFFKLKEGSFSFEWEVEKLQGTIPFTINRKQPVITVTSDDPATHRCKDVKGRCKVTKGQGHSGALIKVGSGGIGNDPHDTWRRDTFKLDARVESLRLKSWRFYIPAKYLKSGIMYEKVFDTKPTTHYKYQYQTSFKFDTNLLKDGHSIPFNFEAVDEANRTTLKTVLIHVDHDSRNLKMYFKTQMHRIPDKGISALQRLYDSSSYLYNEMYHSDILLLDEFAINTPPVHSKKEFKGVYRILLCTKGSVLSSFVFYVEVKTNNRTPIVASHGEAFGYFVHKRGGVSLFRPPPEVFDFTTPVPHEVCRPVQVNSNSRAEGDRVYFKFEINNLYGDKSTIRSSHINKRY